MAKKKFTPTSSAALAGAGGLAVDLRVYGDKTPRRPGRPSSSSKSILIREARDRLRRGDLPKQRTFAAFCRALLRWLAKEHPELPGLKLGTLQNTVRDVWKEHMH